jgi:hypothetical protein
LLGIKVMASDLPLIASPALAVFSMWLFFSFRREHYTVGRLLGDVYRALDPRIDRDPEALLVAQLVYHGVVSQMVFNVVGLRARFVTLDTPVQPPVADLPIFDPVRLNRAIVRWLVWLPTIAIAFITLMRALTFAIIASPVTGTAHSLWDLSSRRVVLVIATILSVLVSLAVTIFNARQVLSYEKETRKVLNEYQRWAFDRP